MKLDIENMECDAIEGAKNLLKNNQQMKLAVCVYHSQDEETKVCDLLEDYNKKVKPGYMTFIYDPSGIDEPFIRHGVILFSKIDN